MVQRTPAQSGSACRESPTAECSVSPRVVSGVHACCWPSRWRNAREALTNDSLGSGVRAAARSRRGSGATDEDADEAAGCTPGCGGGRREYVARCDAAESGGDWLAGAGGYAGLEGAANGTAGPARSLAAREGSACACVDGAYEGCGCEAGGCGGGGYGGGGCDGGRCDEGACEGGRCDDGGRTGGAYDGGW